MNPLLTLMCLGIAFGLGAIAGYLTFTLPLWALGQKPEAMILWGWISGPVGIAVCCLVTFGAFVSLRKLFIT